MVVDGKPPPYSKWEALDGKLRWETPPRTPQEGASGDVKINGIPLVNANPNAPNQANTETKTMTNAQNTGGDLHGRR
jgi:hypothetical protein